MKYDFNDFNNDGVLKVGLMGWLVMLYLSRHLLLFALSGFSTYMMSRRGFSNIDFAGTASNPWFLLASAPAIILFAAALHRSPASPSIIRFIWRNGRWFLAAAALIDLGLLLQSGYVRPTLINETHIVFVLVDLYILFLALLSQRLKDLFADFPPEAEDTKR